MLTSIQTLVPIFVYFLIGLVLRRFGVADREHAQFVFRLVFFVTLPALAFGTIAESELTLRRLALPVIGFLVCAICAMLALAYARIAKLERSMAGAVILGAGIANIVFMYPFGLAILGPAALPDALLYDVGNAIFLATVATAIAGRFGAAADSSVLSAVGKVLRSPLFLAVIAGLLVSAAAWPVPPLLDAILSPLGAATTPLILIALGVSFSTTQLRDSNVYSMVGLRMLAGLVAGALLIKVFGLEGVTAVVVIGAAAAPIGFNAVTLASIGKLDVERATAALSMSVTIGLLTAPAIILATARWLSL